MKKKTLLLLMLWVALTTFAAPKMSKPIEFQFDADDALKMEQVKAETTLAIENGKLAPTRSWTDQNGTQWNAYIVNQGGLWSMVGDGSYTVEDFPTYWVSVYITTQKPDGSGYNNHYILDLCWPAAVYWYEDEDDAREALGDAMWDISPLEWFDDQTVFTMKGFGNYKHIGIIHPDTFGTTCMYNGTGGYTFDTSTTISFANYDAELSWLDINLSGKLVGRGTPNVAMAYSGETSLLGMVPGVEHEVEVGEVHIFDCGDIDYDNDWAFVYTEEFEPVRRYQVCFSSTDFAYYNPETGGAYNDVYTSDKLPEGPGSRVTEDGKYFSFWGTFFAAEGSEKPYGQWTGPEWKQDAWGVFTTPEAYKLILGRWSGLDICKQDGTWVVYDDFYRSPVQDSANMIIGDKNVGMDFTWTDGFGEKWHAAYKGDIFFHNDPTDFLKFEMIPAEGITHAQSINLNKSQLDLSKGESVSLIATVLPENVSNKSVTWTSSNTSVATVDANGLVTAIGVGTAIITATTTDGSNLSASCKVTVHPTLAESITLDKTEISLEATESATLTATILPELATNKAVMWTSSNEEVATVDANGMVTAIAVGEATITATTADGSNLSASCKIIVKPTLATSITLDYSEYEIVEKSDFQLVATVLPELTTNKGVVWSSSDMWVASVDENGLVRAYSVGEAVITATTIDGSNLSASCKVTVVSSLAQSITLDKTEVSLKATETATLVATVLPETTSNKSVEWTSSNDAVATINNNGEVTAIAIGEAIITAITTDGTNLSSSCKVTVVPTLAETITLDKTEISFEATETATLVATVLPELTTDKSVKWSSSDETVAIVDKNGVVTAISVGEATITATTADGSDFSASCKVTVVPTLAKSITLDKTEIRLEATETATLVATVLPELTTNKYVTWTSSNEAVATVDANGVVTAVAVGESVITATTTDGSNLSATCKVTVVPTLATSITLDKTEYEIAEKSDFQLVATVLPELATDKGVVWSSSDKWVASVNENGLVTAYSVGEATITATTTDGSDLSASCKVTVVPTLAESITLDKTEISLEATETATLIVTVLPELTTDKSVEWSSSNESVATIDANGLVTAIAVGEATITATTADGSNLTASCKVTVVPTLAESITLDKTEISLEATETATLIAIVLPELATDKSVKWSSSDETVAVVDENGVVTAVAVGEATITATTADGSNLTTSCKVTVVPTLVVSIELDQTEASVEEKSDLQLTATILPEHATNKEVAWSSSDKWVATVDNYGLVTMYSAGEVVITATTTDGTNLSATCRINVYSGIDGVEGDVIVATVGDNIVVKNAKLGSNVRVYAADGSIITSEVATDGDVVVEVPVKGIYVVAIDGKSFKVMVK